MDADIRVTVIQGIKADKSKTTAESGLTPLFLWLLPGLAMRLGIAIRRM
jgi:hypothetical protein